MSYLQNRIFPCPTRFPVYIVVFFPTSFSDFQHTSLSIISELKVHRKTYIYSIEHGKFWYFADRARSSCVLVSISQFQRFKFSFRNNWFMLVDHCNSFCLCCFILYTIFCSVLCFMLLIFQGVLVILMPIFFVKANEF